MFKEQRRTILYIAAEVYVLFVCRTVTSHQASWLSKLYEYCDYGRKYLFVPFLYLFQLVTQFLHKLHKIKRLYMFRASSAHPQEVNVVNCTFMQPLVFSFSAGGRLVHLLRGDCSLPLTSAQDGHLQRMRTPEAAYMYN